MDIFLTISGLIIGASLFLYSISLLDDGRRKLSRLAIPGASKKTSLSKSRFHAGNYNQNKSPIPLAGSQPRQIPEEIKKTMPERICPICSKSLSRDEPLYATHMNIGPQQKVFIHGCPYCYKESTKKKQGA